MFLYYLKGKKGHRTNETNDDLSLVFSEQTNRTTVAVIAKTDIELVSAIDLLTFEYNPADYYFFNGYLSEVSSKEIDYRLLEKNFIQAPDDASFKYASKAADEGLSKIKLYAYDLFYSRGNKERFLYNLNYNNAHLIIEPDKRGLQLISDLKGIRLHAGDSVVLFDYGLYSSYKTGIKAFQATFVQQDKPKLVGYLSENIDLEMLQYDLEAMSSEIDLFMIGDNYVNHLGDWLEINKEKFPKGLGDVVKTIHKKKVKAGIWLAPFIAEEESQLVKDHPSWLKKNVNGRAIKTEDNYYVLDLGNLEVLNYLKQVFNYYLKLGFDFLRLDMVSVVGQMSDKSRAQTQSYAYKLLRRLCKDKLLLANDAIMFNSYGNFDYVRVGPDVSLSFDDNAYTRVFKQERSSTKEALQNTIYRSFMNNNLFGSCPDIFMLDEENNKMNSKQREALSTINALFGQLMLTRDYLITYPPYITDAFEQIIAIFKGASDQQYQTNGKYIELSYRFRNKRVKLVYNPQEGVFID